MPEMPENQPIKFYQLTLADPDSLPLIRAFSEKR